MANNLVFRWEANEYEEKDRSPDWFWIFGTIVVVLAIIAGVFVDSLLSIIIILAGIAIVIRSVKKPRKIVFGIDTRGIRVDKQVYPFATIASFWVNENPRTPKLIIQSKKQFVPILTIPIIGPDPDDVREFLLDYLFEQEHHESISEQFLDILGL